MTHVRQPLARLGGNSFYRDRTIRKVATLCGADVTSDDVDFRTAGTKAFQSSNAFKAFTCPTCMTKRRQQEAGR